jgi:brefeldin A-resistance guanine nucleotide exchange factor 1
MDELLKSPDPSLSETRLRTAGLICKVFLADATRLAESDGVVPVFTRLLSVMERMVRSERDGMVGVSPHGTDGELNVQNEAGESLKNVLLVLSSAQLLVPPSASGSDNRSAQQKDLWEMSHNRISKILPGFLEENFVPQPQQAPSNPPPQVSGTEMQVEEKNEEVTKE